MKRPQKGDKLRIKTEETGETFDEICHNSRDDKSRAPFGIHFEIVTKRNYKPNVQYSLVGDGGVELGYLVVRILAMNDSTDFKIIVFSTIIPAS